MTASIRSSKFASISSLAVFIPLLVMNASHAGGAAAPLPAPPPPTPLRLHQETDYARRQLAQQEQLIAAAELRYNQAVADARRAQGNQLYATGRLNSLSEEAGRAGGDAADLAKQLPDLRREAGRAVAQVDECQKDVAALKTGLDDARKAVEVILTARSKAYRDGQPHKDAVAALHQAEAMAGAAEADVTKALAASDPSFRKLQADVAGLDARVKSLRAATPADPGAIAEASRVWAEAQSRVAKRVDVAAAADPTAVAALDALRSAKSDLAALDKAFEDSLKKDADVVDARVVLAQAKPPLESAKKALVEAKRGADDAKRTYDAAAAATRDAYARQQDLQNRIDIASTDFDFAQSERFNYDQNVYAASDAIALAKQNRDIAARVLGESIAREKAANANSDVATAASANSPPAAGATTTSAAQGQNPTVTNGPDGGVQNTGHAIAIAVPPSRFGGGLSNRSRRGTPPLMVAAAANDDAAGASATSTASPNPDAGVATTQPSTPSGNAVAQAAAPGGGSAVSIPASGRAPRFVGGTPVRQPAAGRTPAARVNGADSQASNRGTAQQTVPAQASPSPPSATASARNASDSTPAQVADANASDVPAIAGQDRARRVPQPAAGRARQDEPQAVVAVREQVRRVERDPQQSSRSAAAPAVAPDRTAVPSRQAEQPREQSSAAAASSEQQQQQQTSSSSQSPPAQQSQSNSGSQRQQAPRR